MQRWTNRINRGIEMNESPSVLIVGGGPAGSVAALLLVRAGFNVEVLEQHAFPRDKVCGECLSSVGIEVLRRCGIADLLGTLNPVHLTRTLLHPINGPTIEVPLPRPMWGLTRHAIDLALLDAARAAGALLRQPCRCERLLADEGKPTRAGAAPLVQWRDLSTNETHQTRADWVIIADGKGSLLGRSPAATGDLGIKTHFENVNGPRDAIELFAGRGHYGGLAAVEGDRWNAAFSVPAGRARAHGGDLQDLFDRIIVEIPALADRMHGARRVGAWLASPLPRFPVAVAWPDRVIPLGNAAAALEPVGGEGMGLALRSAELAVEAIVASSMTGNLDRVNRLPEQFDQLWRVRRMVCRGIARLFSTPSMADAIAPLMVANSAIPTTVMRWAGKR